MTSNRLESGLVWVFLISLVIVILTSLSSAVFDESGTAVVERDQHCRFSSQVNCARKIAFEKIVISIGHHYDDQSEENKNNEGESHRAG